MTYRQYSIHNQLVQRPVQYDQQQDAESLQLSIGLLFSFK